MVIGRKFFLNFKFLPDEIKKFKFKKCFKIESK